MQVALEEKKNIIMDDNIPAGLDRLDLILEADAKRGGSEAVIAERREAPRLEDGVLKERLNNIDAMIAYIMNELDDLGVEDSEAYEDPDPYAAEALGDEDIDDPLADGHPDYEDPDAVEVVNPGIDHLNDDPYADIEIPPPEGWDPDLEPDFEPGAEGNDLVFEVPPGLIGNREYWRTVDGFPNYEVSHHGNVRNATTGRILKPSPDKDGYLKVCLRRDGLPKKRFIHRLVAKAWLPNPGDKPQVDHIDGNKRNNMLNNLRWATPAENLQNRGPNRLNTTGYKGVDIHKGRYRARIRIPGRRLHLGYFDTAEEAGAAYADAALRFHGAFARVR